MNILNKKLTQSELEGYKEIYENNEPFPNILIQNLFSEDFLDSTVASIKKI